jgi:hypothetical protein
MIIISHHHHRQTHVNPCVGRVEYKNRTKENIFFDRADVFIIKNTCTGETTYTLNARVMNQHVEGVLIISSFIVICLAIYRIVIRMLKGLNV